MKIQKRQGTIVDFDVKLIVNAIESAMRETLDGIDSIISVNIANEVTAKTESLYQQRNTFVKVEEIQDIVETLLMQSSRPDVAKKYIIYRENKLKSKVKSKDKNALLTDSFMSKYKHSPSPMKQLGQFVYYRTYSRYIKEEHRREYWWETAKRAIEYNCSLIPSTTKEETQELYDNVFNLKQFLSGRTFWVGNTQAAKEYPMSNYNCAFTILDNWDSFSELFYLLMIGSGVGLRILREDVINLPKIRFNTTIVHKDYISKNKNQREDNTNLIFSYNDTAKIVVGDSKEGWMQSLRYFFELLYRSEYKHIKLIIIDYDNVRPKGERLKKFGGTASGHESLRTMFSKIDNVIKKSSVSNLIDKVNLKPVDCLDIANIIGENVVSGGVRRSSEIMLIDADDQECMNAKSDLYKEINGEWVIDKNISHRQMSNNSIFYREKPTRNKLHWQIGKMRYSGEPGWVNQTAMNKRSKRERKGVNPCGEILLDNRQMCNLTTVNTLGFVEDGVLNKSKLLKAQRLSARAGYRMTFVEMELPEWDKMLHRDKLVGCSLTGWQDMVNLTKMSKSEQIELLKELRNVAHEEVRKYAEELDTEIPLLVTTVKPEGSLSQLPTVSSGVHYSHSPFFVRRVRISATDPLVKVCEELGYPVFPENGQDWDTCKTKVVEFPVKAPDGRTKYDVSAIEQLENYKMFMEHYVDHNCSITIHVRNDEWDEVEQWVWDNWDDVVGLSFLSLDESFYNLLPYEAITEEEFIERESKMKPFVSSLISKYETDEDFDIGDDSECSSGVCPIR